MQKKEDYYVNQHSCFLLQYHLVLVTKYRNKIFNDNMKQQIIEYTQKYFADRDLNICELNTDEDHIHILFEAYPNFNISVFVNSFKSASSRQLRNQNAEYLKQFYWKDKFWSDSYFICTVSDRSKDIIQNYIQKQGEK